MLYNEFMASLEMKALRQRIETLEELGASDETLNQAWQDLDNLVDEVVYLKYKVS